MSTDVAAGWCYTKHQPAAPDDGRKHRPKHVELIKVNKSK
jgi:hypothetical protein